MLPTVPIAGEHHEVRRREAKFIGNEEVAFTTVIYFVAVRIDVAPWSLLREDQGDVF